MKKSQLRRSATAISIAVIAASSLVANAAANSAYKRGNGIVDYAKVTKVKPVYETVVKSVPVEQCWNERVKPRHHSQHVRHNSATPALLGAIIGGALGNELGNGKRNKQFGVAIGGLLGASVGQDIGRQQTRSRGYHADNHRGYNGYRVVERCATEQEYYEEQELVGYEVSYRYQGNRYTTITANHPGDQLKVRVNVSPVSH